MSKNTYWERVSNAYKSVNGIYPKTLPKISKIEYIKAYTQLLNKFGRKKHTALDRNMFVPKKDITTFRNRVGIKWNDGWWGLIHRASHRVFRFRKSFKNYYDHSIEQANLEKEMVQYAINKNWFLGALKTKKLTKEEKREKKIKNLQSLVKKWKTKQKLADTLIKKYNKKLKYYDKLKKGENNERYN